MKEQTEKKDIVFAIFLIFIGSIFLLNTTGLVGWGIWEYILRFWPVFLVLGGIKLILNQSIVTEVVLTVIAIILFAIISIFSYVTYTAKNLSFLPKGVNEYILKSDEWNSISLGPVVKEESLVLASEYEDVKERVFDIKVGASKFVLSDDSELNDYVKLNSMYTKNYIEPSLESKSKDNVLELSFKTVSPKRFVWRNASSTEFDLTLGQKDLKTDVNIVLGAGRGEVDLKSVLLGSVKTEVGAGELVMAFEGDAIPSSISIDIGAGSMKLSLPENVGYTLKYNLGVGEIKENGNDVATMFGKNSDFKSPNFDVAEKKIEITANVGVGSFEINNI